MTYQVRSYQNILKVTKVFTTLEEAKSYCDKVSKNSVRGYFVTHIENGNLVRDYDVCGGKSSNIRKWSW